MDINKNNCEAFFLDYYEGNLSALQEAQLFLFLEENQELKEVFESFENITLTNSNEISFLGKEGLKKSSLVGKYKNQDELLIDALEGNLSKEEREQFELLLNNDFALNAEYELYKKTKLVPENAYYKEKASLKRNKVIPFYYYVSAAASVVLIFGLYFMLKNDNHEKQMIATTDSIQKESSFMASTEKKREPITISPLQNNKNFPEKSICLTKKRRQHIQRKDTIITNDFLVYNKAHEDSLLVEMKKEKQLFDKKPDSSSLELLVNDNHNSLTEKTHKEIVVEKTVITASIKEKKNKTIGFWDIALLVSKGFNKLTGKKSDVQPKYNQNGEFTGYLVSVENFKLDRSISK